VRKKLGKFEVAHGGTIFLDEIATLTQSAQIKLLQVLQESTFHRVGGEDTIEVDVRVIAATNLNLKQMVEEGTFRKDLYYRINIFPIHVPALSERSEDIPHLVEFFLKRLENIGNKGIRNVDSQAMEALKRYPWPGNIRELENVMERAYVLGSGHLLTVDHFPEDIVASAPGATFVSVDSSLTLSEVRRQAIEAAETSYLKELLMETQGKVRQAATKAGITPRQFSKLIGRYKIRKEEFKSSHN
jgi:DNA-binding NtrC family response regulator